MQEWSIASDIFNPAVDRDDFKGLQSLSRLGRAAGWPQSRPGRCIGGGGISRPYRELNHVSSTIQPVA
jgi:hypothetical protein